MAIELFEQRAAQSRLAGADFARQLHEAFPLADAVKQMIERLAVFGAVKQKPRVRRDVERRLAQAVIVQVHDSLLAKNGPDGSESFEGLQSAGVPKHDSKVLEK